MGRRSNKSEWAERVRAWQRSGMSADDFARQRGFVINTFRWWCSYFARQASQELPPRFIQLVPREPSAPAQVTSPIVIEFGEARIRVDAGFDAALLTSVVRCLRGAQ